MDKWFRFLISGGLVYVVNIGMTYILIKLYLFSPEISYAFVVITTAFINFGLSLRFTFKKKFNTEVLVQYIVALLGFSFLNYLLTISLKNIFGEQYLYLFIFIVTTLVFFMKFVVYDRFVFNNKK